MMSSYRAKIIVFFYTIESKEQFSQRSIIEKVLNIGNIEANTNKEGEGSGGITIPE
jgi:hypothetical protein